MNDEIYTEKNPTNSRKSSNADTLRTNKMKQSMRNLDIKIKLNNLNLRTINDIITQFDNQVNDNENNEEEGDISIDEDNDLDKSINANEKTEIEKRVGEVLEKIFENNSSEELRKLLNYNFLEKLCGFFDNLKIEEFLFNDFDKMLVIKEF